MRRLLLVVLCGLFLVEAVSVLAQAPQVTPTPTPTASQKPPQSPPVGELRTLRIQNFLLKANVEQARYEKVMGDITVGLRAEFAAYEKEHPGFEIDATKLVGVPKKPAK